MKLVGACNAILGYRNKPDLTLCIEKMRHTYEDQDLQVDKQNNSFIVHANIMVHQGRLKNIPGKQTKSLKYIFITRIVL